MISREWFYGFAGVPSIRIFTVYTVCPEGRIDGIKKLLVVANRFAAENFLGDYSEQKQAQKLVQVDALEIL